MCSIYDSGAPGGPHIPLAGEWAAPVHEEVFLQFVGILPRQPTPAPRRSPLTPGCACFVCPPFSAQATAAEKSLRDAAPKVVVDREAELVAVDGHSLRVKNDLALLGLHKWRLPERASAVERRARLPKLTPAQLAQFVALETSVGGCPVRRQSQSQWTACCGSLKLRYNEQHMTLHAEVGDPLAPAGQPLGAHELELAAKVEALIEALEPTA